MFGMEIHEDTTQSRRQAPIMGIAGWSAANPPRRTVLIPVREYEMRARPVRSGWSRVPGHARAVSPWVSPYTAPAPGGRGRRPEAGRGGGNEEGPTSSVLCGEGAGPLSGPPRGDSHHGPLYGRGGEPSGTGILASSDPGFKQLTGIQQRLRLSGITMSAMHPWLR